MTDFDLTVPEPERRCETMDLPVSQCAHCRPAPPKPTRGEGFGPWISASYDGWCRSCGDEIEAGDRIRASDEAGGFVCDNCGSVPDLMKDRR